MNSKTEKKLLHYTGKAIADFNMIQKKDRILVCLSGGKDSFALLKLLHLLQIRTNYQFDLFSLTIHQGFPNWNDRDTRSWLEKNKIPYEILERDTFSIVQSKIKRGKNFCSFCSRLRRGIIYSYAKEHGFTKIALGHHRDDLIASLLMSILYSGEIRSMPPKLLTNTKRHLVIRPLAYCQEKDIITYANEQKFPYIPSTCPIEKQKSTRAEVRLLLDTLAKKNAKVPSNVLNALSNIKISQLMDKSHWNFQSLEDQLKAN